MHHKNVFNGICTIFRPWKLNAPGFRTIGQELKVLEGKENQHQKSAQNGKKALVPYVPQIAVNSQADVNCRNHSRVSGSGAHGDNALRRGNRAALSSLSCAKFSDISPESLAPDDLGRCPNNTSRT
jgi:hypothetical protein